MTSLQKYFISFVNIKQKPEFRGGEIKDCIICTNINFHSDVQNTQIVLEEITESDEILSEGKLAKRFKFVLSEQNQVYKTLENLLARKLADFVLNSISISSKDDVFKSYHVALSKEIINTENKKFHDNFVNNQGLSESAQRFREVFLKEYLKIRNRKSVGHINDSTIWIEIESKQLKLSGNFGKEFLDPEFTDIEQFVQEIAFLISEGKSKKKVEIEKTKPIIKGNIDKLAGHVLVEKGKKIQFNSTFLYNTNKLSESLEEFKNKLEAELESKGINLIELYQYEFKINDFNTCEEEELYSESTLPDDYYQIKEFLDHLVFAVNQPNEVELGNIIKKEIGEKFNLIDSDLVYSEFQNWMLDWMKKKESYFLSYDKGQEFFEKAKQKIAILVSVGHTRLYREKIKKFSITFNKIPEELLKFLNSTSCEKQVFNLVNPQETKFSAIKVHQALDISHVKELYKEDDSYIFSSLEDLINLKQFIEAFKSGKNKLLIIECKHECKTPEGDIQELYKQLSEVIQSHNKKKVVLITQIEDALAKKFKNNFFKKYKEVEDGTNNFNDLTGESQIKLLEKRKVIFQGKETDLGKLVDENSKSKINSEVLSKLINDEKVEICNSLPSLGEIKNYYIGRTLNRQIKIQENLMKETSKFFVTRNCQDTYSNLQQDQDIVLISNVENDNFKDLCKKYEKHNIHWLTDELVWKQSRGTLFKLRQFIDQSKLSSANYEKITDISDNVVVIAAEPGMGKSTVLTYLAEKSKESDPSLWIVRINLNDYTKNLEEANFYDRATAIDDMDRAVDFLLNIVNLKTPLENELFKSSLHRQGNIALLLDGFDEISPRYKEKVIRLLQILKGTKANLWISTRPHMQNELEDELSVFSYTLKPFSEEDQGRFLKKFWGKNLNSKQINKKRLENYTEKLLNLVSCCIRDKEREFASVPLQTRMLAEAFQEDFKNFYNSHDEPKLPEKLGLLDLYQRFIEKKYEIYYNEKMKTDVSNQAAMSPLEPFKKRMEKQHKYLACSTLFPLQTRDWFKDKKTDFSNQELVRIGIINKFVHNRPDFIHRTFAEYFAALWFADDENIKKQVKNFFFKNFKNLKKRKVKTFLRKEIFKEENEVIRNIFDRILADKSEIHIAALNNDKEKAKELLEGNENIINTCDKVGRTALHLAAAYGYEEIAEVLLYKLKESELKRSINVKDKLFNWNPISYLKRSSFISEAMKNHKFDQPTLLHIVAEKGYVNFAKVLITKGAKVNTRDKDNDTPLLYAARSGKWDVVEYLVGKGADVNAKNKDDWTPLHYAAGSGKLDVVEYLVGKGADVNAKNKDDKTPLLLAFKSGELDVVEYLVGKGADVNAKNKDDWTPLHYAAGSGKLDVVEYLVGKGADVNAKNKYDWTPLHYAAYLEKWDVVEYLVGKGADVNAKNKYDSTPLHYAAYYGKSDVVEYLVGKGVDVNAKNKYGQMKLGRKYSES